MISSHGLKKRDLYLNKLIGFQDTEPVKIITGIRRCGKSSLLKLMVAHLLDTGITPEQIEMRKMQQITDLLKYPCMETEAMRRARLIHDMSANFHKMYDGVGMFDFLENELWKFQREWWIEDNINMKSSRDLSQQYKQRSYMDLLNMHRSTNPYVNDLLSNAKYDNNVDDMEIGLPSVLATADQRRRQILEGRVPQFISSAETQKQRNKYFSELTSMIRAKEQQRAGGGNNV